MGTLSIWHWLIVLLVVVLIFGTKKLRNLGGDVGGAVKEFKDAMNQENNVGAAAASPQLASTSASKASQPQVTEVPAAKTPARKRAPAAKKAVTEKSPVKSAAKKAPAKSAAKPKTTKKASAPRAKKAEA